MIQEFKDKYLQGKDLEGTFLPFERMGRTETEKLLGQDYTSLVLYKGKVWQNFLVPSDIYAKLVYLVKDLKPKQFTVLGFEDGDLYLRMEDSYICGICQQSKERVFITEDKEEEEETEEETEDWSEWDQYLEGLGGDWEG